MGQCKRCHVVDESVRNVLCDVWLPTDFLSAGKCGAELKLFTSDTRERASPLICVANVSATR